VSGGGEYASLAAVRRAVVGCERCPRLRRHCTAVARAKKRAFRDQVYWGRPLPGFGDERARLLVVGLAPAAHGGNRTGRMFTGDASGDWLFEALHHFGFANQPRSVSRDDGLALTDCYVSAAVRCAPPGNRPSPRETRACRRFLVAELGLLERVEVVVALGHFAHDAWLAAAAWTARLPSRRRPRFAHGAEARLPDGTLVIASYHPSQRNTSTGLLTRPMLHRVFAQARRALGPAGR
jgi:uracil-DNA glycosylase family 4